MADLNETDTWPEGIYQWEEDDPVLGGPTGIDNRPPRELASRARYQRLRNVTPWVATFEYPAEAYVSHSGTTWKSLLANTGVEPGSDGTKWVRWGHTEDELNARLAGQMGAHLAAADPHAQYALDSELAAALGAHAAAADPHAPYALWESLRLIISATGTAPDRNTANQLLVAMRSNGLLFGEDTGAANAMVVAYTPAITALVDGMVLWVKAKAANTGATTIKVNALGTVPVTGAGHAALQGGEIIANGRCQLIYSATLNAFVLVECTGAALQVAPATLSQHAMQFGQATGRLLRTLVYTRIAGVQYVSINGGAPTTTGAGIYTPGVGMSFAIVDVQGAGAAGGGASNPASGNISMGAPGGAGSFGRGLFLAAAIGASQAITAGLGGTGVAGANGNGGGSSSFGSLLTCPGGVGGNALNNFPAGNLANGNSVLSGAPTGANLLSVQGGVDTSSIIINAGTTAGILPGPGGRSVYGIGGSGAFNGVPVAAKTPGSGGGASATTSTFGPFAGGNGADGQVIILEHS
ncbi:hypothetical protein ACQ858_19570 [Variovorax ureilyticus]|uniref:hypothetical protein n=1 Tax=Variovorax ureilyticus TaxID=1836198 RepID=UPI003D663D45